jgi:DNA-directed RNA polymerase subunit F
VGDKMVLKKIREVDITIAEVYDMLKDMKNPNSFQARALEYARKMTKVDPSKASELVNRLIEEFNIERDRAVQIVNIMPESIEELRIFFTGLKGKLVTASQLKKILELLNEYRLQKPI